MTAYSVYRLLGKEELLHGEYSTYIRAMREAIYLVRSGQSHCARVQTVTDSKVVVLGRNRTVYISGKAVR